VAGYWCWQDGSVKSLFFLFQWSLRLLLFRFKHGLLMFLNRWLLLLSETISLGFVLFNFGFFFLIYFWCLFLDNSFLLIVCHVPWSFSAAPPPTPVYFYLGNERGKVKYCVSLVIDWSWYSHGPYILKNWKKGFSCYVVDRINGCRLSFS
jgi:hypothetical protein